MEITFFHFSFSFSEQLGKYGSWAYDRLYQNEVESIASFSLVNPLD